MKKTHLFTIIDSIWVEYACGNCCNIIYGDEEICPSCGSFIDHTNSKDITSENLETLAALKSGNLEALKC